MKETEVLVFQDIKFQLQGLLGRGKGHGKLSKQFTAVKMAWKKQKRGQCDGNTSG